MEVLIIALVFFAACGVAGGYVSGAKGRPGAEGALLGFLFGPLGLLVAVLMPTVQHAAGKPRRRAGGRGRGAWMPDYDPSWDAPKEAKGDPVGDQVADWLREPKG
jgi:hypothetical protein